MSKIWTVTVREYFAAVKTKGFLISLVLLPVMMGFGFVAGLLGDAVGDSSTHAIAVIDHTGGFVYDALTEGVEEHNADLLNEGGRQVRPRFELERVEASTPEEIDAAKVALSERVRDGDLLAFVEIGENLLEPKIDFAAVMAEQAGTATDDEADGAAATDDEENDPLANFDVDGKMAEAGKVYGDDGVIRYTSNQPTYTAFRSLISEALGQVVPAERLRRKDVPPTMVLQAMLLGTPPIVTNTGLYETDESGAVVEEAKAGRMVEGFAVPFGLLMLLFLVVMVGTSPMTANVIEEKQLRIAEVLLAGVRPFDLMLGKLLGGVGVALTLAVVYLGGAYLAATYYGLAQYVRPDVMLWFAVFTILAALLFGALFAAAGAAVTNVKEAQTLITPIMLILVVPLSMFLPIIQQPNGVLAKLFGFFPLTASMVTIMRVSVPPGIPLWEILLAVLSSVIGTLAIIWIGGRIFRIGMLSTGKAPSPKELLGWVVKG